MLHLVRVDCALPTRLFSRWRWQVFATENKHGFHAHVQQGAFSMSGGYPHGNLEMGLEFAPFFFCMGGIFARGDFFPRRINKLPNGHCPTWTHLEGCLDQFFCGASSFSNFFPINSGAMIIKIVLARLLRSSFSGNKTNRVGATTNEKNMHQSTNSHSVGWKDVEIVHW